MAGYSDTRQLIIDTLMGRPAGTEIQPEDHQAFALALNDYIRSVELVAGSGVPVAFAEPDTVPVQPDNGQAVYLSQVNRGTTRTFTNFIGQDGNAISITSDSSSVTFVTLLWNGQYWSKQTTVVSAEVLTAETFRVTFTRSGNNIVSSDSSASIRIARNEGKYVYAILDGEALSFSKIVQISGQFIAIFNKYLSNGIEEYRVVETSVNRSILINNPYIDPENSLFPTDFNFDNFIVRAFIENPQDGYKYGISAVLNGDNFNHLIYIDRYLESDPSTKEHIVQQYSCPGVGEYILTATDSSKIHLWVNWSGVETAMLSWGTIFLQFSDFCYSVNPGTFIPLNSVSAKNVTDEIEKTSNRETTEILSGETEKYPSSFTVKQNIEKFAKKDDLLSQFLITSNDFVNLSVDEGKNPSTQFSFIPVNFTINNILSESLDFPTVGNLKYVRECILSSTEIPYSGIKVQTPNSEKISMAFWINVDEINIDSIYLYPNGTFSFYFNILNISEISGEQNGILYKFYSEQCVLDGRKWRFISINLECATSSQMEFLFHSLENGTSHLGKKTYLTNFTLVTDLVKISPYAYYTSNDISVEELSKEVDSITQSPAYNKIVGINSVIQFHPLSDTEGSSADGGFFECRNVLDSTSIFKDLIGKKLIFTNTNPGVQRSSYRFEIKEYANAFRTNRPKRICFSGWFNKTEWGISNISCEFLCLASSSVKLSMPSFSLGKAIYSSIGTIKESAVNNSLLSGKIQTKTLYSEGDLVQIGLIYDDIEWKIPEGEKWMYGIAFNGMTASSVVNFTLINPQIIEDNNIPVGVNVISDGTNDIVPFPVKLSLPFLDDKIEKNTQELISQQEEINEIRGIIGVEKNNILHLSLNEGEESYIISSFNQTKDIKVTFTAKRVVSLSGNSCLNFNNVSLIDKDSKSVTYVHSVGDDACPGNYNNTYIGANHGDSDCLNVTSNNHGKTPSDIGSLWEDSLGNECVLVGVPDENHLWFFGQNTLTYPKFTFNTSMFASGVTLTHKSGALNTGSILISGAERKQWYCAIRLANLSVILDDNLVSESGDYEFNKMEICEDYDVLNPASVIEQIKARVGTFSETPNPQSFSTADKVVRHSIIYHFDSAYDWKIITNFIAYQDINIGYFGFTQQAVLSGSDIHMYIPKALPISNGQEVLDFRTIASYNNIPQAMNITSTYWENPLLPPDRWLEFSENIGLHSGYLFDYGVGGNDRKDNINNAFYLYTSRKCYPHGIDNKISVDAGDSFSAVTWRKYIDRDSINSDGIISKNVFEYDNKVYIYGDFNQIGIYEIEIPNEYVGKKIDIFENSENVTLLNEISSKKILVKVSSSNPLYGYIVASIKK